MRKLLTIVSLTFVLLLVSTVNAKDLQTYGPTTAKDQLWRIAQSVRPSREVTKQQTMMAILKANPQAFSNNNVNGLLSGYRLTIPPLDQIKAIPALSALSQISAQNAAWGKEPNPIDLASNDIESITPSNNASTDLLTSLGLMSAVDLPITLFSEHSAQEPSPLTEPTDNLITASVAEKMIKNGIATHIASLSQKFDDFLVRFNQLDKQTQQRLDSIADEHVAMKNQIASLDKQMQQLRENYLQYSTPILHRSAFSDYGFWIMGSSVLACLLVLIFNTSRRRESSIPHQDQKSASPHTASVANTFNESIEAIDDEYDYLGSQEGISAKLDLARAYIDMGDTEQASLVLNEVLAHGNEEQRHTARKILSELTRDTVH